MSINEIFDREIIYPDMEHMKRYNRLVGLDETKQRLEKILSILINPKSLTDWAKDHHGLTNSEAISVALRRPPLVILAGDVGTGKTEISETIGDNIARINDINIKLLPLSLSSRGKGRVGEMTALLTRAFEHVHTELSGSRDSSDKAQTATILLVDEADALVQSRSNEQMHHEDRAGVNAFLRGVDRLCEQSMPVAILLCTNRLDAIDPAVKRRAAEIVEFHRPTGELREKLLTDGFEGFEFSDSQIKELVHITGEDNKNSQYSFTSSDIVQRLIPNAILAAYPEQKLTFELVKEVALKTTPTPPFGAQNG